MSLLGEEGRSPTAVAASLVIIFPHIYIHKVVIPLPIFLYFILLSLLCKLVIENLIRNVKMKLQEVIKLITTTHKN